MLLLLQLLPAVGAGRPTPQALPLPVLSVPLNYNYQQQRVSLRVCCCMQMLLHSEHVRNMRLPYGCCHAHGTVAGFVILQLAVLSQPAAAACTEQHHADVYVTAPCLQLSLVCSILCRSQQMHTSTCVPMPDQACPCHYITLHYIHYILVLLFNTHGRAAVEVSLTSLRGLACFWAPVGSKLSLKHTVLRCNLQN